MKIAFFKNNNAIELVLLLLCPLLAVPFIISGIAKGKQNNLVLLSFVMAILAFIFPPFADLYRHTQQYLHFQIYGNSGLVFYGSNFDFIFYTLSNFFAKNNIPFEYIRSIFVFISYQISFYLYKRCLKEKGVESNTKESFLLFWVFFLSVPFIWIVNGLRMATACYIAVFGWVLVYNKRYIGLLAYIFALCLHFGSLLFAPIFIFLFLPKYSISKKAFLIITLLLFVTGGTLLSILPHSLITKLNMQSNVDYYMKNSSKTFDSVMSVNGLIAMYLERIMLVYIYMKALFGISALYNKKDDFIVKNCLILWLAFLPFTILFQKISLFIIPIVLFLVLKSLDDYKMLKNIVLCCIISFVSYLYGYRKPFLNTPIYEMFTTPAYIFMNADTKNTFEQRAILK